MRFMHDDIIIPEPSLVMVFYYMARASSGGITQYDWWTMPAGDYGFCGSFGGKCLCWLRSKIEEN